MSTVLSGANVAVPLEYFNPILPSLGWPFGVRLLLRPKATLSWEKSGLVVPEGLTGIRRGWLHRYGLSDGGPALYLTVEISVNDLVCRSVFELRGGAVRAGVVIVVRPAGLIVRFVDVRAVVPLSTPHVLDRASRPNSWFGARPAADHFTVGRFKGAPWSFCRGGLGRIDLAVLDDDDRVGTR